MVGLGREGGSSFRALLKFPTSKDKFLLPLIVNRRFSRFFGQKQISIVYYDEIKDLCNHPEKLLIDVRDRNEVKFGKIPLSINIPLCELRNELAMEECDGQMFENKYGRPKPVADTYMIMYCRTGQRATIATEIATKMGYRNVHNYCGSWLDYVRRETCS
ncbi:rhodanese domain-containing protein CG4456-like [Episyrphus balteatus]|uniref:rhodanese domain-containing protein CG4456-like n=1 Tax=Episyrphus balteatus TaxID=286459 RepID=UPI00248571FE|nr:rhodanese domain-containing protein CG4456-like [Episyrphus balteatus]